VSGVKAKPPSGSAVSGNVAPLVGGPPPEGGLAFGRETPKQPPAGRPAPWRPRLAVAGFWPVPLVRHRHPSAAAAPMLAVAGFWPAEAGTRQASGSPEPGGMGDSTWARGHIPHNACLPGALNRGTGAPGRLTQLGSAMFEPAQAGAPARGAPDFGIFWPRAGAVARPCAYLMFLNSGLEMANIAAWAHGG